MKPSRWNNRKWEEYDRLVRKGDQESEMGSLALSDGDKKAAAEHFRKANDFWNQSRELL